jgi:hypothetical protein
MKTKKIDTKTTTPEFDRWVEENVSHSSNREQLKKQLKNWCALSLEIVSCHGPEPLEALMMDIEQLYINGEI